MTITTRRDNAGMPLDQLTMANLIDHCDLGRPSVGDLRHLARLQALFAMELSMSSLHRTFRCLPLPSGQRGSPFYEPLL